MSNNDINIVEQTTDIDINSVLNDKLFKNKIQYYPSNYNGTYISNANTGEVSNDKVGTYAEKKYFRVIDATGNVNGSGMNTTGIKTPNKLFYNNAADYIKYRNKKYNINNITGMYN